MGSRPWLAHSQHDYAAMLLARDEPGDREQASRLVREALATYRQLGMLATGPTTPASWSKAYSRYLPHGYWRPRLLA